MEGGWHTHENDKHRAIAHLATVEELAIVPPALVRADIGNILHHLAIFEAHQRGVPVPFAVVFGQDADGCFMAVAGDQPSGALYSLVYTILLPWTWRGWLGYLWNSKAEQQHQS